MKLILKFIIFQSGFYGHIQACMADCKILTQLIHLLQTRRWVFLQTWPQIWIKCTFARVRTRWLALSFEEFYTNKWFVGIICPSTLHSKLQCPWINSVMNAHYFLWMNCKSFGLFLKQQNENKKIAYFFYKLTALKELSHILSSYSVLAITCLMLWMTSY
jgi:hypothetical protein